MLFYENLAELEKQNISFILCTIINTKGSTPRKSNTQMAVFSGGIIGTIGGGALEFEIIKYAKNILNKLNNSNQAQNLIKINLTSDLGMCCGGQVQVYLEHIKARPNLFLFGAGHINRAICHHASRLNFNIHMADPRESELHIAKSQKIKNINYYSDYELFNISKMPINSNSLNNFSLIATHSHQNDQKLCEILLSDNYINNFQYIGCIGSKRKYLMTKERLKARNFRQNQIDSLNCPAGLSIGAQTPEQIAISIMAQIISLQAQ